LIWFFFFPFTEPVAREAFYREKGTTVIMCLLQNEMEQITHSSRNFLSTRPQVSDVLPVLVEVIYKASLNCKKIQNEILIPLEENNP
jgi:hypothetical protein